MDPELLELLEAAFPRDTDAEVIRAMSEGILLGDDLMESSALLRTPIGRDLRGHLRRAGISFRLHDLCSRGDLPFSSAMVPMPHGNWHWLEMRSGSFKAHVCRTEGVYEFPIETLSRQDERLRNQPDLFETNVVSLSALAGQLRQLYTWLTFGASRSGTLEHLCWAMPPADEGQWLAHVDILRRSPALGREAATTRPPEPPGNPIKLRFKEHVEEALAGKTDEKKTQR